MKEGTPLSKNEAMLFEIFRETFRIYPYGATIRQIEGVLFSKNPRPTRASSKSWNAHTLQADMSRLTGRGLVSARKMDRGNALIYSLPSGSQT